MSVIAAPVLSLRHLSRMTTERGVYEHARDDSPRAEHGYCTDDAARALVVATREPDPDPDVQRLVEIYLRFVEAAVTSGGRVRNRMTRTGRWVDEASIGDWWGRAVGGLGFAAVNAHEPAQRARAMRAFDRAAIQRSRDVRASAFAALGAAAVLEADPDLPGARALLADSLAVIPIAPSGYWTWPEATLRYANATLCEALIAGGHALGRADLVDRGLELLAFLVEMETGPAGTLSITGSAGRRPGQRGPLWDQQPIEAAAIADACAAAYRVTGSADWLVGLRLARDWFLGANDSGVPMIDPLTGAGYDGLEAGGRNRNRGAESTLAALSTLQQARVLDLIGVA